VGHDGQALNIGRRARSIPPAIRRALMLRDHGCAFPGCTHTRFLHAHHLQHWLHGGATSLDNLVMLCSLCRYRHKLHYADYRIMPTSGAHGPSQRLLPLGLAA
jgi:5-methylcytosine-specific restriction endonuclease McrA